jgi:hypothetical protein
VFAMQCSFALLELSAATAPASSLPTPPPPHGHFRHSPCFPHQPRPLPHRQVPFLPYWIDDTSIRASIMRSQVTDLELEAAAATAADAAHASIPVTTLRTTTESDLSTPLISSPPRVGSSGGVNGMPRGSSFSHRDPNMVPTMGKMRSGSQYQMINPQNMDDTDADDCCLNVIGAVCGGGNRGKVS